MDYTRQANAIEERQKWRDQVADSLDRPLPAEGPPPDMGAIREIAQESFRKFNVAMDRMMHESNQAFDRTQRRLYPTVPHDPFPCNCLACVRARNGALAFFVESESFRRYDGTPKTYPAPVWHPELKGVVVWSNNKMRDAAND